MTISKLAIVSAAVVVSGVLTSGAVAATVNGTPGPDVLRGTDAADVIRAGGSNDRVVARSGDDRVFGGTGADLIVLGPGADRVRRSLGQDRVYGGPGPDVTDAVYFADLGRGTDRYNSDIGEGCLEVRLGVGHDVVSDRDGWSGTEDCVIRGGPGRDRITWSGTDAPGRNPVTRLYGGPGADVLRGGYTDDTLVGAAGSDRIFAHEFMGPDRVLAGRGDDELVFDGEGTGDRLVDCGPGIDTVRDVVLPRRLVDCEIVHPSIP
jgi:Ca2+-binding RTX toxin-like protein